MPGAHTVPRRRGVTDFLAVGKDVLEEDIVGLSCAHPERVPGLLERDSLGVDRREERDQARPELRILVPGVRREMSAALIASEEGLVPRDAIVTINPFGRGPSVGCALHAPILWSEVQEAKTSPPAARVATLRGRLRTRHGDAWGRGFGCKVVRRSTRQARETTPAHSRQGRDLAGKPSPAIGITPMNSRRIRP